MSSRKKTASSAIASRKRPPGNATGAKTAPPRLQQNDDGFFDHLKTTESYREEHCSEAPQPRQSRRDRKAHCARMNRILSVGDPLCSEKGRQALVVVVCLLVFLVLLGLMVIAYRG